MLRGETHGHKALATYGFLVAIEAEEGVDTQVLAGRLLEGIIWIDGVGKADAECLGPLDVYPEPQPPPDEGQPTLPFEEKDKT